MENEKKTTLSEVQQILRDFRDKQDLVIMRESRFDEFGLDSLDTVELLFQIEDKLNVKVEMANEKIETVGQIIDIIDAQLQK